MVLGLCHSEHILVRIGLILAWRAELQPYSRCSRGKRVAFSASGGDLLMLRRCGVQRLTCQTSSEMAHLLDRNIVFMSGAI